MVHEFRTTSTVDAKMDDNAKALNGFLHLLQSANDGRLDDLELSSGQMVGPVSISDRPVVGAIKIPIRHYTIHRENQDRPTRLKVTVRYRSKL